jgi:hypothetical protein
MQHAVLIGTLLSLALLALAAQPRLRLLLRRAR